MSTQFEHKGVKIDFGSTGRFSATVNGENLAALSLESMRKKIDKALAVEFQPFDAYFHLKYADKIEEAKLHVVGIRRTKRKWGSQYEFIAEKDGQTWRKYNTDEIILDTPENRKALIAYLKLQKKNNDLREQLDKEITDAYAALPFIKADDYVAGKSKPEDSPKV